MYNFFNRHYIFKQSDGEILDFYCDNRQNLCSGRLSGKTILPDAAVIARNVHQFFYADMDEDNIYHVLYQDNDGNINYINLDGQSRKTFPVLGSKTPSAYNKQLYIAPLKNEAYLFYVLQHDNSFLLAYQTVNKEKIGTPKIVDYVSGSSIPCSIIYDSNKNIYAFYQSYDGKYLQLGYKKMDTARKHWSDFIPVTKYMGNCEYPHSIIDTNGTIHLCYQRRTQRQFELVYQKKGSDKNLWSGETVLHSSIYPFENSSVVQADDKINIYWIRDDVIYYVAAQMTGDGWSKPARYGSQPGRQLQCIWWKEQSGKGSNRQGAAGGAAGGASARSAGYTASPGIYPGTLSNGIRLAFLNGPVSKVSPQLSQLELYGRDANSYTTDMRDAVLGSIKQLQENVNEINTGWTGTKKELARMTNAYIELSRELAKYSIRLNLLESKLKDISSPYRSTVTVAGNKASDTSEKVSIERDETFGSDIKAFSVRDSSPEGTKDQNSAESAVNPDSSEGARSQSTSFTSKPISIQDAYAERSRNTSPSADEQTPASEDRKQASEDRKPGLSLDPEARKVWEDWQEPKEWSEGS